jgi:hypothetical protein
MAPQDLPLAGGTEPPVGKGDVRWKGRHPRSLRFVDNEEPNG